MPAHTANASAVLALVAFAALGVTARAAETKPAAAPPAPAAATAVPPAPAPASPAAISAADLILGDLGVKQSIALVVPSMMTELERNVSTTRPEIRESLRQTLRQIQPDFDKTAQQTYTQAAEALASLYTEKEITDLAAFFQSPLGRKYVANEPVFLQKVGSIVEPWRDKLSTDILVRARAEMKKKGVEF